MSYPPASLNQVSKSDVLVRARGLTKRFGDFTAVDGIDFDLYRGEAFGFLGPNGAGKSSTMRMIGCVSPPSGGELTILGTDPVRDGSAAPAILATGAMNTAMGEASYPVFGSVKWNKIYIAAQASPLGPGDIFRGHLMFMTMRIAMNAAVVTVFMWAFGATRSAWVVLAWPAATLTGLAFAASASTRWRSRSSSSARRSIRASCCCAT